MGAAGGEDFLGQVLWGIRRRVAFLRCGRLLWLSGLRKCRKVVSAGHAEVRLGWQFLLTLGTYFGQTTTTVETEVGFNRVLMLTLGTLHAVILRLRAIQWDTPRILAPSHAAHKCLVVVYTFLGTLYRLIGARYSRVMVTSLHSVSSPCHQCLDMQSLPHTRQ